MILLESYVSGSRRSWCITAKDVTAATLLEALRLREGCGSDVVLQCQGRVLALSTSVPETATVVASLRLRGGKGGFGSMLRAIGAQIEKTTNREACRDLSGRRLRDINEEKRLKDFISKKAEREREVQERKRQKFESLKETPKHVFQDETYYKQREKREKNLYDSLDKAFCGSSNSDRSGPSGIKRSSSTKNEETTVKIKKGRFIDDLEESSEGDSDDEEGVVAVAREGSSSESEDSKTPPDTDNNNKKESLKNGKCVKNQKDVSSPKPDSSSGNAT